MSIVNELDYRVEGALFTSTCLKRDVILDFYLPTGVEDLSELSLLLINDGQDLQAMDFKTILSDRYSGGAIGPVLCAGITAGADRKREYGVAATTDYLGRGDRAGSYTTFIINELLPFIAEKYNVKTFRDKAFAGFSLGGLSALDIVWNHPEVFSKAAVFSGSLWWRSIDQDDPAYDDDKDRIMQQQIRNGAYAPGLKFFLQCGLLDEAQDRNNNGIIDAVDDTRDTVAELMKKGYQPEDLFYLELDEGKHDVATWGKAMPVFLEWSWPGGNQK
ncbi:alpha/beta hydrolase [Niabella soli]|uniref:Esterase n=1 Tax=Niabella soli DSM 19437 TaxID=929713 RepID=W0F1D4_9BACT|nr:alpha/beta hydrolase-fold protein [Niabella soli]AHF16817.1 esterase [Niabella soli DSM 19437]